MPKPALHGLLDGVQKIKLPRRTLFWVENLLTLYVYKLKIQSSTHLNIFDSASTSLVPKFAQKFRNQVTFIATCALRIEKYVIASCN